MTLKAIPTLNTEGLRGGVQYYDGQFDDARLLINLVQTASQQGAALLNYVAVTGFLKDPDGCVNGVTAREMESGEELRIGAKCIINATGPFVDRLRQLDDPSATRMVTPSQGIHLVFDKSFLPGDTAIMVPRTSDGRVMFAIPWHGHAMVGTTDTPISDVSLDPIPKEEEIEFILGTAGQYLVKAPRRADVLSMFAGIRPLVGGGSYFNNTASLSRDHTIHIDRSGLLTITGGKWTTYRFMAEDCVNHASTLAKLEERPCVTRQLKIHGFHRNAEEFGALGYYGADAPAINDLSHSEAALGEQLHERLPYRAAQVTWAVRFEMARTVDDFLSRRTRATMLNARAAQAMAPTVAAIMARELDRDESWVRDQVAAYNQIVKGYILEN
jgi:glycerol-3-phosphate dehydrogenase